MEPFSRILTGSSLIAAFGDEMTALLMYDAVTVPVPEAPGAECHTVQDGKIVHIRIVFAERRSKPDDAPWRPNKRASEPPARVYHVVAGQHAAPARPGPRVDNGIFSASSPQGERLPGRPAPPWRPR